MKIIRFILCLLILSSCAVQKSKKKIDVKDITLEVNVEKTEYKSNRWTNLYVVIKNNSGQDITLLQPSNEYGYQMDFFKVKYLCEDQSIVEVSKTPVIKKTETDLITVKAKSEIELKLLGNLYNVICDSQKITQVIVTYNTNEELSEWIISKIGIKQNKLKEQLTKIEIKSSETTIE